MVLAAGAGTGAPSLTSSGYGDIVLVRFEKVSLPPGPQSLVFNAYLDQSTEKVNLPPGPQSFAFNAYFDQSTEKVSLPFGFQRLTFVDYYVQSTEKVSLPSGLQRLTLRLPAVLCFERTRALISDVRRQEHYARW